MSHRTEPLKHLTIRELLRPHQGALAFGLLAVIGEGVASLLEPWPLKIVLDNVLKQKQLDSGWLNRALYQGPSLLPALWAAGLRTFPYALALLWPAVRLVPAELAEAARADGATPFWELRHAVWPLAAPAFGRAALAVTVLSLGELSAGKLVATPGGETFAHEVFKRMHYGVTNHLAALCLVLLAMVAVPGAALAAWRRGDADER